MNNGRLFINSESTAPLMNIMLVMNSWFDVKQSFANSSLQNDGSESEMLSERTSVAAFRHEDHDGRVAPFCIAGTKMVARFHLKSWVRTTVPSPLINHCNIVNIMFDH